MSRMIMQIVRGMISIGLIGIAGILNLSKITIGDKRNEKNHDISEAARAIRSVTRIR